MVDAPSWPRLAKLVTKHNKVQAIIDTAYMSTRFYFTGPPGGDDEQQAEQDLCYIRVAAEGASTREQGLHAKALARGGFAQDAAGCWFARFQYVDAGITKKIFSEIRARARDERG